MLRLHFSPADLGRVTIAGGPEVMLEFQQSVRRLRPGWAGGPRGEWRRQVLSRLPPAVRPVLDLVSLHGTPDFLLPLGAREFGAAVEEVLDTPTSRIRAELAELGPLDPWQRRLAGGDIHARRELGAGLLAYHETGLAPHWSGIWAAVCSDQAVRGRAALDGGLDRLLGTLHPDASWASPVLSIRCPAGDQPDLDFHLGGRGLHLVPLYFGSEFCYFDLTDRPPYLLYPIPEPGTGAPASGKLAALLGRNRAAVLAALRTAGSTSQVARRAGTSVASASEHTTVLRAAGLITSARLGPAVLHTLTPLGEHLLRD